MHRRPRFRLGLIVLLLPASVKAADFSGKVIAIADGDTLTVLRERTPVKIRLHGIDAPESKQEFGSRAKQAASELAFGETVTVRPVDKDRYGRTVAEVILPDGRTLNHEVVRAGYAWWYQKYAPNDETLKNLEAEAREAKRGLWSQPSPVPPWEWRQGSSLPAEFAGKIVGNRSSHVYHRPGCPNASKIAEKNRIVFTTNAAAEKAGYRPGKDCYRTTR